MAERVRKIRILCRFYVYRIFDGLETVAVGTGCGYRMSQQMAKFRMKGERIEEGLTEAQAYKRERHWIKTLLPTANMNAGGGGGMSVPKPITKEERNAAREYKHFIKEYQDVGPRRYVARFLLTKLDERNCATFGLAKVDINRWREIANGAWC